MRQFFAAVLLSLALAGCDQMAQNQMDDIHAQVIKDAEEQFRIVEKTGTKVDKCVRAGLVAEAYLQAQKEEKYGYWQAIRDLYCT